MKKFNSIIFALIAFAFISCNDDETEPDIQAPSVVFSSPTEGAVFNEREKIWVEAEVTDELALEMVSLSVSSPGGESLTILTLSEDDFNDNRAAAIHELFTPGPGVSGNITFTLEATDKAGNTTTESITMLVQEADREAPLITIHKPADETAFHPDDAITLESHVTDDSALGEITVWVTPEGGLAHLVHTVNTEDYSNEGREATIEEVISLSSGTPLAGSYTLTIRAEDTHGNSVEERMTIHIREVDTHAPKVKINNPVEGATYSPDEKISLRAEILDNLALESVTVSLTPPGGDAQLVHTANPEDFSNDNRAANISEAISFGTAAPAGEYTLTITATDAHENVATESVLIHVHEPDPNAPAITIYNPEDGTEFNAAEEITFEARVEDESALESVRLGMISPAGETQTVRTLNSEDFSNNDREANISETISLGTAPGNYTITVEATDKEGNTSDKSVRVLVRVVDTSAPDISIHDPVAGAEFTTKDAVYIRANVADQSRLDEVTVWLIAPDGQTHLAHTENRADFLNEGREAEIEKTISLGSENPAPGIYTVMVRATDEKGNTAEESVDITVREADTTAPTITLNSPEAGSSFKRGDEVMIDAIIEDDKQLAEIHVKVTLSNITTIHEETITEFDEDTYHRVENTTTIPGDAPTGTYIVTITATDAAGNQTIETLKFKVTAGD